MNSVFDGMRDEILLYFSQWIQVNDNKSGWTIEDFPYQTGVDEALTYPHCWKCVTVNQCWFKNEENKKPLHFDYSKYSYSQIAKSKRGLYHPNCHCKENSINVPRLNDIEILKDERKIKSFFDEKSGWFYGWGYQKKDKEEFVKIVKSLTIEQFRKGNYECEKHTKYGYQINIFVAIPGKNEKARRIYDIKTSYIIFPNGKLRCVTLVGGKD